MGTPLIFIFIAILALMLLIYLGLFLSNNPHHNSLTLLATLAFIFVLTGIIFGKNQYISYGLIAAGVIIAIADIIIKINNNKKAE